ncbi:UNVERIFIED_CONTAM: Patellin-6 [Sesamum indicum]
MRTLRARDFRVQDSLDMLLQCLAWRKDFGADGVLEQDLGFKELEGTDKIFGDDEKLNKFLRWRVQILERGIKLLQFKPGGVNSIIQVAHLKDMPKRELRVASNHILSLFQDNYPEMVARKIFINVPCYFSLLYSMFSPFFTQRSKSKFAISKQGNVAETLYKYIRAEDIPVQYGGLSRPSDVGSGPARPASEFTGHSGGGLGIGLQRGVRTRCSRKLHHRDGEAAAIGANKEAIRNSFATREAGKLVLSVDNTDSHKRKVGAYRYLVRKSTATS